MKTLKTSIYLIVCTLCISFTTQAQEKTEKGVTLDFENYDANLALLKEYVTYMNAGDAAKLNALFNDDAIIVGLNGTTDTISKKQHLDSYMANFKENKFTVTEDIYLSVKTNASAAVAPGEYGFSWGNVASTNKATKKTAMASYHVVALVNNGKLSFLGHYYDTMPFALRDGATLTMPKK